MRQNTISGIWRFWSADRSLSITLLLLMLFIFLLAPLLPQEGVGRYIIKLTYSAILLTGILSVVKSTKKFVVLTVLGLISLIAYWIGDIEESQVKLLSKDAGAIIYNSFFAVVILIKTFQPGDITFYRIQGSIVVYLLFGLIFGYLFHLIYLVEGASSFNNISSGNLNTFFYYSFTTLTTMGYGDITPVHPMARSIANFEALVGQLYPAILIARLVSMEFDTSKKRRA